MQAKYAVALILALQVSMSLCETPTPSAELVQKYNKLRARAGDAIGTVWGKMRERAAPLLEAMGDSEHGKSARTFVEDMQTNPEFQDAVRTIAALTEEAKPRIDNLRTKILGLYEYYFRPYIGDFLSNILEGNDNNQSQ